VATARLTRQRLQLSALGVPVVQYAPYYFFGFFAPLILLVMGATGWKIFYKDSASTQSAEGATPSVVVED
jgi:Na+/H+ antiporter NhaC